MMLYSNSVFVLLTALWALCVGVPVDVDQTLEMPLSALPRRSYQRALGQPKITYSKAITTKPGKTFRLDCAVENLDLSKVPGFRIFWKKIDEENPDAPMVISENKDMSMLTSKYSVENPPETYKYILNVNEADELDSGVYRCLVYFDEEHKINADVPVMVEVPAYFADNTHKTLTVVEGDALSISCEPSGSPIAETYWERVDQELPYYGGKYFKTSQFEIPAIHRSHEGRYRCHADNGLAEPATSDITINVDYKPEVEAPQRLVAGDVYLPAQMNCEAHGNPRADIIWFKNGLPINQGTNYQIENSNDVNEEDKSFSKLVIKESRADDFGEYVCAAYNYLGTTQYHMELSMKKAPLILQRSDNHILYEELKDDRARDALPLLLECRTLAVPAADISWTKEGEVLVWQNDPRMSFDELSGTLSIERPTRADNGEYQCFATNEQGSAFSEIITVDNIEYATFEDPEPEKTEFFAELGRPFSIKCPKVKGNPLPTLSWARAHETPEGTRIEFIKDDRTVTDPDGTLWFAYISEVDDSVVNNFEYLCLASTDYSPKDLSLAKSIHINVVTPSDGSYNANEPSLNIESFKMFSSQPKVTFKTKQENKLWCIFGGEPSPKIQWVRTDGNPFDAERVVTDNFGRTLVFTTTLEEDNGSYKCSGYNDVGSPVEQDFQVKVEVVPEFRSDFQEQSQVVTEGTSVVFSCAITSGANVKYEWFFNSRPIIIGEGSRRKIKNELLTIDRVTTSDIGNYACKASNDVGYTYGNAILTVVPTARPGSGGASLSAIRVLQQELESLRYDVQRLSDAVKTNAEQNAQKSTMLELLQKIAQKVLREEPQPAEMETPEESVNPESMAMPETPGMMQGSMQSDKKEIPVMFEAMAMEEEEPKEGNPMKEQEAPPMMPSNVLKSEPESKVETEGTPDTGVKVTPVEAVKEQ